MPASITNGRYAWLLVWWMGCSAPSSAPLRAPEPDTPQTERHELTSEQCEAQGGEVVGDIGDGATRRPDYLCPGGKAPTGNIAAPEGGPMPIEGAVCCPR